jgi:hypothetical protein
VNPTRWWVIVRLTLAPAGTDVDVCTITLALHNKNCTKEDIPVARPAAGLLAALHEIDESEWCAKGG